MVCPRCGSQVAAGVKQCPACGSGVWWTPPTKEERERLNRAVKQVFCPIAYFELCYGILKEAAQKGNADAQNRLGEIYAYGWESISPDPVLAEMWYKRAAKQGHEKAAQNLKNLKGG